MNKDYDLCIIGSGPGGYVTAIKASQVGFKVCLIEKDSSLGGVCLNRGCIPTKALLSSVKILKELKHAEEIGIKIGKVEIDLEKIIQNSRNVVDKLSKGVEYLISKNKIDLIKGFASFINKNEVQVFNDKNNSKININAKNFIIATGSVAKPIPNIEFDENLICSAKGAMLKTKIPKKLTIIGGGVIGVEFASFYSSLGTEVLIIEAQDSILIQEDKEISSKMTKILKEQNIKIITNSFVKNIEKLKGEVEVSYTQGDKILKTNSDFALVCIGINPNSFNLNLDKIGVKINKFNFIEVNENCQTNIDNIYAIGDVNVKTPWLAHKASHEGIHLVDFLKTKKSNAKINYRNVPSCIYSYPQVSSIGLTEAKANELKLNFNVGKFNAEGCGKALASNDKNAFVKILVENKTGEILGCHIISDDASEIIHSLSLAMNSELTDKDITNNIFPHPTISEMIHEAILDSKNLAIHK